MSESYYQPFEEVIAAGASREFNIYANELLIFDWDGDQDAIVKIGDQAAYFLPAGINISLPGGKFFRRVIVKNPNVSDASIRIAFTTGRLTDSRFVVPSGSVFDVIQDQAQGDTTAEGFGNIAVAVTPTLIAAANAGRKSLVVQNDPNNTGAMFLGFDNTVNAASKSLGIILPGQFYSIDAYRGDLYAIAQVAAEIIHFGEV